MFTTRSDGVCRRQTLAERAEGLLAPQRKIESIMARVEYHSYTANMAYRLQEKEDFELMKTWDPKDYEYDDASGIARVYVSGEEVMNEMKSDPENANLDGYTLSIIASETRDQLASKKSRKMGLIDTEGELRQYPTAVEKIGGEISPIVEYFEKHLGKEFVDRLLSDDNCENDYDKIMKQIADKKARRLESADKNEEPHAMWYAPVATEIKEKLASKKSRKMGLIDT